MVVSMGLMITAIVFIPDLAIQILFIAAYSFMLFSFTFAALEKWYVAILPALLFILFYIFYWELFIFNLFGIAFAIMITIYLSSLFSWKTLWIFAILLTIMDIIQVFVTEFMGQAATKMIALKLPVVLLIPTYPAEILIGLGLGDIFFAGLLSVQTTEKFGRKAGFLTAGIISVAIFIFEVALFNFMFAKFFPATVVVIIGWLVGLFLIKKLEVF
jgi:hypothetical protein